MEKNINEKLKVLHIGADPEFISPIVYESYLIEIEAIDNVFSVSQWIRTNGMPDALICEKSLQGENSLGFCNFWVKQFDQDKRIPIILLDDEKNREILSDELRNKVDGVFSRPANIEALISKILQIRRTKSLPNSDLGTELNTFKPYKSTFIKRTFDLIAASIGLVTVSPLLLIFIIAIRIGSKGGVFYISRRVGSGFKVFDLYKLRSMYIHGDKRLKELAYVNEYIKEEQAIHPEKANQVLHPASHHYGNSSTITGDPRITRVGHIIRRLKIDELPQLLNVIKGDISIVGNRPLPIYEAELLTTDDWTDRFNSPAGITGPWKAVTPRKLKAMSHEERNRLQNRYSEIAKGSLSFWKDMWLILRTIF